MMASLLAPRATEEENSNCIQPTEQEVINCSITSWYKSFEALTFKSLFLPLSQEFVQYLLSDGCVLPQGCSLPSMDRNTLSSDSDEGESWGEGDTEEQVDQVPVFTELVESISQSIEALGGAVLPKLNWSSPRDAVWVVPSNSLRCTCAAEVILLLKSSNFITHDLTRVFEFFNPCTAAHKEWTFQYQLCLRKWESIHPSSEFRCFVHSHQLIGICQRNHTACYEHLLEVRESIKTEIENFFQKIKDKFPDDKYVFDISRIKENAYWLVDFNPYSTMTDPLLFSWEELSSAEAMDAQNLPMLRLVDGSVIQPSDLHTHRLPRDIIDLTSGEDIHKFADLFIKGSLPGQESDSEASD